MDYADDGESVSARTQRADVKNALRSAFFVGIGRKRVTVLDCGGDLQATGRKTRDQSQLRRGAARRVRRMKKEEAQEETERVS